MQKLYKIVLHIIKSAKEVLVKHLTEGSIENVLVQTINNDGALKLHEICRRYT